MKKDQILERLGLGKHESAIYLALLELGPSKIAQISEKTSIHRPLVYKALPVLIDRKLVTQATKGKGVIYVAEPPNRLETMFEDLKLDFFEVLPELEDKYVNNTKKLRVRFLEGKDGTRRIFDDVVRSLKKDETFYRYSSNIDGVEKKDVYLPRDYRKLRDSKKLQRLVITNEQTRSQKTDKLDRFIKIMPKDYGDFDHNVTQIIYGDRVAFIDYNSETALIIESKAIADFQAHIFKNFYKKLN